MDRIVIIGLGLIGGSLGLTLKRAKLPNVEIVGVDRERDAVVKASRKGAVDATERRVDKAVQNANMVIVATPVLAMKEVFQDMAQYLPEGCVVTDTGSTKGQIMKWADEFLPPHVSFVGGHPMAGKETPGIDHAEAGLFEGCTYCIMPSQKASTTAVEVVVGLANTLESQPFFVNAEEHDILVGGISHLPILLSAALVAVNMRSPAWDELRKLASSGFRDMSRLASSDMDLSRGICATNKEGLIRWVNGYLDVLREYRDALAEGREEDLMAEMEKVWLAREKWLRDSKQPPRDKVIQDIPTAGERMAEMFMGGTLSRLFRREQEMLEKLEKGESILPPEEKEKPRKP